MGTADNLPKASVRPKSATIHDVAKLAGVSHQTVSRYLRGNGGLRPATVTVVAKAMTDLKYSPNLNARSLRTRKLNRLIIVIPEATRFLPPQLLRGASTAAHDAGFLLDVVALEGGGDVRATRILSLINSEQPAGILSFSPLSPETQEYLFEASAQTPILVAGEFDEEMRAVGTLADGSLAKDIVDYLASMGHRRFFHIAGPRRWPSAVNRRAVFESRLQQLGLEYAGFTEGDWSSASGYAAALDMSLTEGITAVFSANDQMALGAMHALMERNVRIPSDISVFGWNDSEESPYYTPSLSTVSMDLETQGRSAMEQLVSIVRNEKPSPDSNQLQSMRLIIRESTGEATSSSRDVRSTRVNNSD